MPLKIQNIKAIFVDNANYYSGTVNNLADIRINLQVIDEITGEAVIIDSLNTFTVSNDPFLKPSNTIVYEDVPNTHTTGINLISVLANQFGTSVTTTLGPPGAADEYSTDNSAEFRFVNWPLSVESAGTEDYPGYIGGVKKAYFTLEINANNETLRYPEVGVAEIVTPWATERPTTPSVPNAETISDGKTGPKISWNFATSNEESTINKNNIGISRYISDIIEIRSIHSTGNTSPMTLGTDLTCSAITLQEIAGVYSATTTPITLTVDKPDFGAQFYYKQVSTTTCDITFSINCGTSTITYTIVPNKNSDATIKTLTSLGDNGAVDVNINVPAAAFYDLDGGLFDVFYQEKETYSILAIYYTHLSTNKTYMLELTAVDSIIPIPYGANPINISMDTNAHGTVEELTLISGKFMLNADMGDCLDDEKSVSSFPIVSITDWRYAIGNTAQWEDTSYVPATSTVSNPIDVSGTFITMNAIPPADNYGLIRPIKEIQTLKPSFSNKVYVSWEMVQTTGDFYIALSPIKATSGNPMIKRCDPDANHTIISDYLPTLAFMSKIKTDIYGSTEKEFSILYNDEDNLLSEHILGFLPNDNATKYLYEVYVESDIEFGTSIVVKINNTLFEKTLLTKPFGVSNSGLGWYLAMGVRSLSDFPTDMNITPVVNGSTTIYEPFYFKGIPPSKLSYQQKQLNIRHFSKCTNGSLELKPLLGQLILSGNTNGKNFSYSNDGDTYKIYAIKIVPSTDFDDILGAPRSLIEFKMKSNDVTITPPMPKIRFYSDSNNKPDSQLTDWISCATNNYDSRLSVGDIIPYNNLVQFDISSYGDIQTAATLWVYVAVPPKCSLGNVWIK